eukprot:TRINITY_DN100628_c0_g1_i1.p1 TRINITY_DN100628_c0_g1~~TRINITY_DN100628_c0_g1_i1.p1  ORF type:complete len:558 (-),score=153.34 TRINITY_DN100628_c0_g1_i1:221-1894(-)
MLRMIRSARSRASGRDSSVDTAGPLTSEGRNHGVHMDVDSDIRRPGTLRATAGAGPVPTSAQSRTSRSRSINTDYGMTGLGAENMAAEQPVLMPSSKPTPQAPLRAVLGEVQNRQVSEGGGGYDRMKPQFGAGGVHTRQPTGPPAAAFAAPPPVGPAAPATAAMPPPMPRRSATPPPPPPQAQAAQSGPVALQLDSSTPLAAHASEADVDMTNAEDPQHVPEYACDIMQHLLKSEAAAVPRAGFMERQPHVNEKMRAILVDWLVDVHRKYKLRPETLFLGISIVDRSLDKLTVLRKHLQLVGVTAMLLASKFEEVFPPQVKEFIYVTDKAYSHEEVMNMEVSLLAALDFKICQPTAYQFADRYSRVNRCTEAHRDLVGYLLELTLMDVKLASKTPSHLAAGALYLSNKLLRKSPSWPAALARSTRMSDAFVKESAKAICALLEQAETNSLQAVRKKYSQQKYHSVAKLNFTQPTPTAQSMPASSPQDGNSYTTSFQLISRRRSAPTALPRSSSAGGCRPAQHHNSENSPPPPPPPSVQSGHLPPRAPVPRDAWTVLV